MGSALLCGVLRRNPSLQNVIMLVGSPLNHPTMAAGLHAVGLDGPVSGTPVNFYNVDDPVCAGGGICSPPMWCRNVRVAIPGQGALEEHDAIDYLEHPLVAAFLRENLS
jgi:hypothetical protein